MECSLYLASGCNMQCKYCYEGPNKINGIMSKNIVERSIDFIVKENLPDDQIDLLFLGGEPLLNKQGLTWAIELIKRKYKDEQELFRYSITTNGTLLDSEIIDVFEINNFAVSISIDGDEYTNSLNRRAVHQIDSYGIVLRNLEVLMKRNVDLCARMTVTANNVFCFCHNVRYLLALGLKKIHIGIDMLSKWDEKEINEFDHQLDCLDQIYMESVLKNDKIIIDLYDYKIPTFVFYRKPLYCSAGTKNHLIIDYNGDIYPCGYVSRDKRWKLGTVDDTFSNRLFISRARKCVQAKSSCEGCDIAFTCCGAKCGFLNFTQTNYLNQHNEQTCKIQRILYKHNYKVIKELWRNKSKRITDILELAAKEELNLSSAMKDIILNTEGDFYVQSDIGN